MAKDFVLKGRAPRWLVRAAAEVAARTGRTQSELVRDAVKNYVGRFGFTVDSEFYKHDDDNEA